MNEQPPYRDIAAMVCAAQQNVRGRITYGRRGRGGGYCCGKVSRGHLGVGARKAEASHEAASTTDTRKINTTVMPGPASNIRSRVGPVTHDDSRSQSIKFACYATEHGNDFVNGLLRLNSMQCLAYRTPMQSNL